jgi:nucleoside-diphosphate-sugar epimerase
VIPLFTRALLEGRSPMIYGDGSQTRDFTFVANAVYANLLAGVTDQPLCGEVINVACGRSFAVMELLEAIAELLGAEPACERAEPRVGEVQHSLASIDAARDLIDYAPIVDFRDGLEQTIADYRQLFQP